MEHREPPPDVAEDPPISRVARAGSDRLALPRPEPAHPRRPAIDRARSAFAVAFLSFVLLGAYVGYRAIRAAVAWLGEQPTYQLAFRDIRLDPPPPSWLRGGSETFLQDVRRRARMPERFSLLALKQDELKRAFERSPWTEEVSKTTFRPHGVTIHLAYHQPVALVETSSGNKYLVDGSAIILPKEDLNVDLETLVKEQGLIRINGKLLIDPQDPEPGIPWRARAGVNDIEEGNFRIEDAARLSAFLVDKMRSIDRAREPSLHIVYINPMDPKARGLFLWNAERTIILWGKAPGQVDDSGLDAEEKWERLLDWSRTGKMRAIPPGDYWKIERGGVIHQKISDEERAEWFRRPKHDGAAIPAKDSGQ